MCDRHHAVGYFKGAFVGGGVLRYTPLVWVPEKPLPEADFRQAGEFLADAAARRKGAAGFLLTHPPYLREADELRTAWAALPATLRPVFPLRPVRLPTPAAAGGATKAAAGVAAFAGRLTAFQTKWRLASLPARDLPEPQGPLLPNPLPADAPALPLGSVTLTVTPAAGFPAGTLDALVAGHQATAVRQAGVDPRYAALQHYKQFGQMLDVLHLERAVFGRYPAGRRPRGLMGAVVDAVSAAAGLSRDRVIKLRKNISLCRLGKHAAVPTLRV